MSYPLEDSKMTIKLKRIPLISIDTNAKTVKGQKEGFLTGILYMAPANLSGYNTCAMASIAKCDVACLNTAGSGKYQGRALQRVKIAIKDIAKINY